MSNAHPVTTYLDLVGEHHLPSEVVSDVRRYRTRSGSVKVNLALGETVFEPSLAPEGKHVALCFTQFGPYEPAGGSWEMEREAYGLNVVRTLGEYCPGFEASVEHMEVLGPFDIEERFGLMGGNIFQGEMAPDQMFSFRPVPGYGDYRTPIAGLYLCGSGTHPGGGVMAVPGRNCAQVVLGDAKRSAWVSGRRSAAPTRPSRP